MIVYGIGITGANYNEKRVYVMMGKFIIPSESYQPVFSTFIPFVSFVDLCWFVPRSFFCRKYRPVERR